MDDYNDIARLVKTGRNTCSGHWSKVLHLYLRELNLHQCCEYYALYYFKLIGGKCFENETLIQLKISIYIDKYEICDV
ncbi:hypothetical protein QTP88_004974 [Uroleucon formosanum]